MDNKKIKKKADGSRKLVVEEIDSSEIEKSTEETPKETVVDTKDVSEKPSTTQETSEEGKEEEGESKKPKPAQISLKQVLMIAIPTAIVVAALTGGILYYLSNSGSIDIVPLSTTKPSASPEEIATPEPIVFERSEVTIQVLNGSGIAGYAGDVKDLLEDLGYVDVDTANADTYDFTETVVAIKEESEDYLDMVVEDLSETYIVSEETEVLDESHEFDIVITVGSELQ